MTNKEKIIEEVNRRLKKLLEEGPMLSNFNEKGDERHNVMVSANTAIYMLCNH